METSTEKKQGSDRRKRRSYTDEFRAGAVRLVLLDGQAVTKVAKDLDLTRSALDGWVRQAQADAGKGVVGALTMAEKEELVRLRRDVRVLKMERDILKNHPPAARFCGPETPDHVG